MGQTGTKLELHFRLGRRVRGTAQIALPDVWGEALIISICVLNNQRLDPLRVPRGEAKPDRPAEVLEIKAELVQAQLSNKLLHAVGQALEGRRESIGSRRVAVAKPWIVGGNQVKAACKLRHQVPKHVRGRRKSMQQQQGGVLRVSRLTVKDADAADFHRAVRDRDV